MKERIKLDVKLPEKLQNGEKIICEICKEGILTPVIEDVKHCTCFICDHCGTKVNIN